VACFEALVVDSVLAPEPWWRITGTKGEIVIEGGLTGGLLLFDAKHRTGVRVAEPQGYAKSFGPELEDFSRAVLDGAAPAAGPEASLGELRTVLALYRSVKSERWEPVWD
jgi:predicted dehydrogenase